jgi:L-ribulose-5-phosphate 3-epimerase
MLLGYNTNGFAFHGLEDAVSILHELGYGAVGLTLDVHHLNPFTYDAEEVDQFGSFLKELGMRCVVETGARFLLDRKRKHQPTLVDPDPSQRWRRTEFLEQAIGLANLLDADAVSFWSGAAPEGDDPKAVLRRLEGELAVLLPKAGRMRLALEPEPGMAIATTEQGMEFVCRIGDPRLGLTVDVGHVHCLQEGELPLILRRVGDRLFNVHIEDMKAGVHDHLMFGEGEMDFPPIFAALKSIGYVNGVYVELSRHAHDAVAAATRAMDFLKPLAAT